MRKKKRLAVIESDLDESRLRLNFGTDMHSTERQLRKTLSLISSSGLLHSPSVIDLQIVAESALLLGRSLRLRGSRMEARTWIQRSAEMFEYVMRMSDVARPVADRLSEALNALTLIELDTYVSGAGGESRMMRAINCQRALYQSGVRLSDRVDSYLEVTQRTAEYIQRVQPLESVNSFISATPFRQMSSQLGDHSRALRFLFLSRAASAEGDQGAAAQALLQVESLPVIFQSNFVRIMYLEALGEFLCFGDPDAAQQVVQEAIFLRSLERVNERGN
ncbi:hypothetical protein OHB54_13605 [Streptomyces sp. NBC_01007]|nr:hypothetical protein OHB54_13605 [Streptomyces sp. NBC_01007]